MNWHESCNTSAILQWFFFLLHRYLVTCLIPFALSNRVFHVHAERKIQNKILIVSSAPWCPISAVCHPVAGRAPWQRLAVWNRWLKPAWPHNSFMKEWTQKETQMLLLFILTFNKTFDYLFVCSFADSLVRLSVIFLKVPWFMNNHSAEAVVINVFRVSFIPKRVGWLIKHRCVLSDVTHWFLKQHYRS